MIFAWVLVIVLLIISVSLFVLCVVALVRFLIRNKRWEDSMQRQRERENAQMWARIQEEKREHERICDRYQRRLDRQMLAKETNGGRYADDMEQ